MPNGEAVEHHHNFYQQLNIGHWCSDRERNAYWCSVRNLSRRDFERGMVGTWPGNEQPRIWSGTLKSGFNLVESLSFP
jgi:hypothetical protein